MRPMILVTGATGSTGSAVAGQLLAAGWPVRALVHRVDARAERLRALGADIVTADLFDVDGLTAALHGSRGLTTARRRIRACTTAPPSSPTPHSRRGWSRWWR